MKVVAIIQARMGSARLPGKVLISVGGRTVLAQVVRRAQALEHVDQVVVATSTETLDNQIEDEAQRIGVYCFRGSQDDVLDRYYQSAIVTGATHVVRLTADCPLLCPIEGSRVIQHHLSSSADYTHNITVWGSGMPLGTGIEVFTIKSLEQSWREGHEAHHREHVDEYVGDHPELFRIERVEAPAQLRRPQYRLTVDTIEDLSLMREIYQILEVPPEIIALTDVVRLLDAQPELLLINQHVVQKTI